MARLISVMGSISRDQDTMAALHLVYTLATFAESLADLREAHDRLHQAQAARTAARQLRSCTAPPAAGPTPTTAPAATPRYQPAPSGPPQTARRGRQR